MKKVFSLMLLLMLPVLTGAQDLANFILMEDGTYQTEDGKDFVVIPFEGKDAHQIYQELASNVNTTFKDPSKVMSGVEDASIKIRAYSECLVMAKPFGFVKDQPYGGYYQLEFKIRDGRVRVSAPIVENDVEYISYDNKRYDGTFPKLVNKYFKNGVVQEKKKKIYDEIVTQMNSIVNSILHTTTVQDATEDW